VTTGTAPGQAVCVLSVDSTCPQVAIVDGDGRATALVWPGVGARERSMHLIELPAGGRTRVLRHEGEAVYYVKQGSGTVAEPGVGDPQPIVEGSMIHAEPGTAYRFEAGDGGLELLGGPCPCDPRLYEAVAGGAVKGA
jgi:quercetin dioxygenase-like cupin family protein